MEHKDGFATAGLRTTSGFPPWADFVPETDAPVVARLRAAGAILLGKTNLPTLSMDAQANNPLFGRTHNPCTQGDDGPDVGSVQDPQLSFRLEIAQTPEAPQ